MNPTFHLNISPLFHASFLAVILEEGMPLLIISTASPLPVLLFLLSWSFFGTSFC